MTNSFGKLSAILATVVITVPTPGLVMAADPCGGATDKLWAWAWAGQNGNNVTLNRNNFGLEIAHMQDQSGNGNHYYNDDPFNQNPPTRPGYQVGFSRNGYSTNLPLVGLHSYSDGTAIYLQWMKQDASISAGEFYLAFAGYDSRDGGHRVVWGTTSSDRVRLEQERNSVDISIGGSDHRLTSPGTWQNGPILVEIWRDASNRLHAWVNGTDATDGTIIEDAIFNLSGIGGGTAAGSSAWDDYAFEYIACRGLPTTSQRYDVREYLRSKWNLFSDSGIPPADEPRPNPPSELVVN